MGSTKQFSLFLALFAVFLAPLCAQPYLADLKNEDLAALDQRLRSLGLSYKNEPLVSLYLTVGTNSGFLGHLMEKGSSPNRKAANVSWPPLTFAIMQNMKPEIVATLLQGGAKLDAAVAGVQGNVIDAALDKQELRNAGLLLRANQRTSKEQRLTLSERYKDDSAFLLDDLISVRGALAFQQSDEFAGLGLALAGSSKKVLRYLLDFQINPNFNAPGKPYENIVGNDLLASNIEILNYLLTNGLARDRINFDGLYRRLLAEKDSDSIRALKAIDKGIRPELYRAALAAGLACFKALTSSLEDLEHPALFQPADLSTILYGVNASQATPPLLADLYLKSDFATIAPILAANPSETGLTNLFRFAFTNKKPELVRSLVSIDTKKVRPELYVPAIQSGIESLKALTHDLDDLKTSGLFGAGGILVDVLFKPSAGQKCLLDQIFERSDFPTVLAIIQAVSPPPELLAGKEFSADYQMWLNRTKKDFVSFGFDEPDVSGQIQGTRIDVTVPSDIDVTFLAATFSVSGGVVTVNGVPKSAGETENDFTTPVEYTVTAEDGSKRIYTVVVTVAAP